MALYHHSQARENCGFGLITHLEGVASHRIVRTAISGLARMQHRGGISADGKTGDGCGLLMQKPDLPIFVVHEIHRDPDRFFQNLLSKMPRPPPFASFMGQLMTEMNEGKIRKIDPRYIWMNVMGMTVFPFVAAPLMSRMLLTDSETYHTLLRERVSSIQLFIKSSLLIHESK